MARLFIQISKSEISGCLDRGKDRPLVPGPVIPLAAPLAATDRDAWSRALQPLRSFLSGTGSRPAEVILVLWDVRFDTVHLPRIPKMSPRDLLEAHLRLRDGDSFGSEEVYWREPQALPGATAETTTFVTISLDVALSRRLREIPVALGCGRAAVRILPYPMAAAAAAVNWVSEPCTAVIDLANRETALTVVWHGVPVGYYRADFGVDTIVGALCTKLAVSASETWSLPPAKAREILSTLEISQLRNRIAEESLPNIRQILQALEITLEKFRNDVGDAIDQIRNTLEVTPAGVVSWSACPLVGVGEYLKTRLPHVSWCAFDPGHMPPLMKVAGDEGSPGALPLMAIAGADTALGKTSPWEQFSQTRQREQRVFRGSQKVMACLAALVLGTAVGYYTNAWVASRVLLVQRSLDKADESTTRGPTRLAMLRKESAVKLQLVQTMGMQDLLARQFLVDLSTFVYKEIVVDLLDIGAVAAPTATGAGGTVVLLTGRAARADQELQEFVRFLAGLPTVKDAVLENVDRISTGGGEKLPSSFRIRVRLKGKS